jgi:hypothetical protein
VMIENCSGLGMSTMSSTSKSGGMPRLSATLNARVKL